eukprot:15066232-Ditylum_brightwellii.AAC.1
MEEEPCAWTGKLHILGEYKSTGSPQLQPQRTQKGKQWLEILEEATWKEYEEDTSPNTPVEVTAIP